MFDRIKAAFNRLDTGKKRWLIVAGFCAVHALMWVLLELIYFRTRPVTDTTIYYHYSSRIVNGFTPYADFSAEYPPVAMLIFLLPRLVSGAAYSAYVYWFELEMLLFGWANILLLSLLAWRRWESLSRMVAALGLYTVFTAMMGFIIPARFDLAAAFLILATVAAFIHDRRLIAWALIGVGIMTKVVPLFLAPLLLIVHYRRRQLDWLFIGPVVAVTAAAIIAIPFLAASPEGLARAFLYHAERPLQIESSWSTPILIMSFFGYGLRMFSSYGSHNIFTPLANLLATLSSPVTIGFIGLGYWCFWKRISGGDEDRSYTSDQLIRFTVVTIAIFIAGSKVFSPQFMIWMIPLVPLIYDSDRNYLLTVFGALLVMTQLEFPFYYGELLAINPLVVLLVAARNALLIWMAVTLMRRPVPRDGLFGMYKLRGAEAA